MGFNISEHFDVVIDMCAYNGSDTKSALSELSFDFFIHFGSVASYKKSELFPLDESAPSGNWPFMGDYNKGKVECEQELEQSGKKYASIRPTYILGPENYLDRENFIYQKLNNQETITLPGNGQALTQFVFAKDVAKIIVLLVETQKTGAFNSVGDELVTLTGLVEYMASLVGKPAKLAYNPETDGANHNEEEFPFANENLVCTNQKVKDLGIAFTPLFKGLEEDFNSYYKALLQ